VVFLNYSGLPLTFTKTPQTHQHSVIPSQISPPRAKPSNSDDRPGNHFLSSPPMEPLRLERDLNPWFRSGLTIQPSGIHGRGLFTAIAIPTGDTVMRLGGFLFHITDRRSPSLMPSTTIPLTDQVIVAEPTSGEKDLSDYLNHSCDPNLGFLDALTLVAIKEIAPQAEVLTDYAFWECEPDWRLKDCCNCGSPLCRRHITGTDWERISPSDPTVAFFSPFLRRRIHQAANHPTPT
jgi:hypothetical protein